MAQRISMVSGVAQVQVFGAQKYAVRVQLDPHALASRGIGIDEVADGGPDRQREPADRDALRRATSAFTVQATGQLTRRRRTTGRSSSPTATARRCASSELGQRRSTASRTTRRRRGTSTAETLRALDRPRDPAPAGHEHGRGRRGGRRRCCRRFERSCRRRSKLHVLFDRSESIRDSVDDVKFTMLLALVAGRAGDLPLPAQRLGDGHPEPGAADLDRRHVRRRCTPLGYSLDNLSLMALTLSVGFVVDDAIVMLENIVRHMEMGKPPLRGGARRLARDRLHDPLDDAVARRGVHPGAVHAGHPRPAVPRVRGHDLRRDPDLRLRVADA